MSRAVSRWQLTLEAPFDSGNVAWVAPCTRPDGTAAVLKVNFPEPDSEFEADALRWWDGRGAVRVLDEHREDRVLLVDRCRPGTMLWELEDEAEALTATARVLDALWQAGGPRPGPSTALPTLAADAERWAAALPGRWERLGRPCPRALIDEAVTLSRELRTTQPELVFCHQDAHGGNILRRDDAGAEDWCAIDPKPILGERAFDLASALRDRRPQLLADPSARRRLARRLDLLVDATGVDRSRARGWAIVHALAWGIGEASFDADMLDVAALMRSIPDR